MPRYKEQETQRVYAAVDVDVLAWFDQEAKRRNLARSVLLQQALAEYKELHRAGPKRRAG